MRPLVSSSLLRLGLGLALVALGAACGGGSDAVPCVPDGSIATCVPLQLGPFVRLEADCTDSSGCPQGQQCWRDDDFPTGSCSNRCDPKASQDCGFGTSCAGLPGGNFCVKTCGADYQCPSTMVCSRLPNTQTDVCLPRAVSTLASASCPAAQLVAGGLIQATQLDAGTCVKPVGVSALPGTQVVDAGTHRVGDLISVNVPQGVASVTVVAQAVSAADSVQVPGPDGGLSILNAAVPSPIVGPQGIAFNDLDAGSAPPIPELSSLYVMGGGADVGVTTFPNTSLGLSLVAQNNGVPAGTWTFGVNDYAYECAQGAGCVGGSSTSNTYNMSVLFKSGPPQTTGTVDLAIYLMSSALPTSQAALSDPNVARTIQGIERIYGAAGICLGKVTFYDVPDWAKARFGTVSSANAEDPCSDIHQMFTLSQPGNTLNLFFVDAITDPNNSQYVTLGIDGTIPGPASIGGTAQSGAIVTASFIGDTRACELGFKPVISQSAVCGPDAVAYVAAHEGGHFMGLYHTTEAPGDMFDPLFDTPICDCAVCSGGSPGQPCASNDPSSPNPYLLQGPECTSRFHYCGGGADLMFWLLNEASTGALSPEQARVMASSPAVH